MNAPEEPKRLTVTGEAVQKAAERAWPVLARKAEGFLRASGPVGVVGLHLAVLRLSRECRRKVLALGVPELELGKLEQAFTPGVPPPRRWLASLLRR